MIEGLKPYPKMKDSGVPWLGRVPEHWGTQRAKHIYRSIDIRTTTGTEELLTVSSERGVVPRKSASVTMFKAESYVGHKLCWPDDLVINSLWAWGGGLGVSKYHGIISTAYGVYRLRPQFIRYAAFFHSVLRSHAFNYELRVRSKGIWISRLQLTDESFLDATLPIPPDSEQALAVQFLTNADRRIRRLIRSKQKLVMLLEEQKQSIIFRAVTRGLNPDSNRVDSGSAVLGDVPDNWPMFRAKYLFKQVSPAVPADSDVVTCFRDGQVTLRSNRRTQGYTVAIKELGYQGIRPGQMVLHSMDAFAGAIGISDSYGRCSPEYVLCESARDDVHLPYFATLLRSLALRGLFVQLCPSVRERAPRVRFSDFGAFRLPTPPLGEQVAIVAKITHESDTISVTLKREKKQLELLREFRTRLISDVVTGKLDVREAAARLPEESIEGDDPFDDTNPDGDEDDDSSVESGPEDGDGG